MSSITGHNNVVQDIPIGNGPNTADIGPISADIDGTSDFPDNPQSAARTSGVEKERVDPYTLETIEQLMPFHHGIQSLVAILRLAMAKQIALPEVGLQVKPSTRVPACIGRDSIRVNQDPRAIAFPCIQNDYQTREAAGKEVCTSHV